VTTRQLAGHELIGVARSFLFVPGDRPERFEKAVAARADLVIIDLEDAVAPAHRADARNATARWLAGGGRACVRVNAATSPDHQRDMDAVVDLPGLVAVMLAKAEDPAWVASVAQQAHVPVIPLIENAAGLARAAAIAAAAGGTRLAFGHLDFALDIGAAPTWTAMLHARSALVVASRAAGRPGPIDGVTTALDDPEVLAEDLRRAKELGMTGKLLVHPGQVLGTHLAFRPTDDEVRWALGVLHSTSTAGEAARVDGQMVDAPVTARAAAILRHVERSGRGPDT
jgi:citrate lyase subunit beta/citryl-CoA lyase